METGDDSFDDDSLGIQAFHVDSEDDDLDLHLPPTTGNQYLKRVRKEANGCPRIVVAEMDTNVFNKKQTVHVKQWIGDHHPAPSGFAPCLQWQQAQVANFAEQRLKLAKHKAKRKKLIVAKLPTVPHCNDVESWCRLCFGRLKPPARRGHNAQQPLANQNTDSLLLVENECNVPSVQAENDVSLVSADVGTISTHCDTGAMSALSDTTKDEEENTIKQSFPTHEGILPLVSFMVAMDQATVIKVLEYHLNWFEVTGFTERQGYWFYALLVCLDKPLTPDACSLLRGLARACSRLRASLENKADARLVPLNLFICLIARYFDQSDLKDDVR
ncbi:gem-associated protein 2-like [Mya arenaria]|uniref:gem-associated protein 2-like n=1 Tax=Mya arenaria TaxID=6604 RepID=UPI0022E76B4D|nr:gem-associated protein 2-like [Mya arenaria]XP_052813823.1 gem-associated protein 2-like [Mya arenaria]